MKSKKTKVIVTGGAGFLGTFVVKELIKKGAHPKNIFVPRSKELDLKKYKIVANLPYNITSFFLKNELPCILID